MSTIIDAEGYENKYMFELVSLKIEGIESNLSACKNNEIITR